MLWNRNTVTMLAGAILLTCSIGCSSSRWLSRKDYAKLGDPFLASPQLAADSASGRPQATSGDGIVRLGQPPVERNALTASATTDSNGGQDANFKHAAGIARLDGNGESRSTSTETTLRGPKPIQTASNAGLSDGLTPIAQARYPDAAATQNPSATTISGPSLSDFMTTDTTTAAAAAAPSFSSQDRADYGTTPGQLNPRTVNSSLSPSAGGTPQFANDDLAAFQQFVQSSGRTATASNSASGSSVPGNRDVGNPFSEFEAISPPNFATASGRNDNAAATFEGLPPERSRFEPAPEQLRNMAAGSETARPLGARAPAITSVNAASEQDDPFDQAAQQSVSTSRPTLDNSFNLDSGWKPSHFVHP